MAKETKGPQAVLTQACYAALGAGDIAVAFARKLSGELPDQIRSARERLPDIFAQLADRGRRLTGQVAGQDAERAEDTGAAEPTDKEPEAVTTAAHDRE